MSIYLYLPAVSGDDGADKAEAESEPGLAADVTAIKAIPDVIDVVGRDAGPGVCDGDCDRAKARSYVRARPCVDRDAATWGRVLHGVVDQIGKHLPEARA